MAREQIELHRPLWVGGELRGRGSHVRTEEVGEGVASELVANKAASWVVKPSKASTKEQGED